MRPSSSATTATTVRPLPSSRAGTPAKARWRSTKSGSASSSRARSRSPPATLAISVGPRRAAVPRRPGAPRSWSSAIGANSMRTHRDAIVTRSAGTKSARMTKCVDGGGSSMRLEQPAGAGGVEQVELVEHEHLARALDRGERRLAHDLGRLLGRDGRARRARTSWTSGCSPASTRRASRPSASSRPVSSDRGEGPRRLAPSSSRAGRRTGRRAPDARRPGAAVATASAWPTTPSQTVSSR